ncbi:hypothetical protein [Sphingomonas hankookensis]|uniref:DNA polymerase III subunit beta n=1 Tax=Sphingomonas hengshuiensis TaxID=1609977 RepID=A0A2W4YWG5_9SPHN|nr:MAG: hypothetical protein DI632_13465 [Sphingomonas hengshuiensis]
MRLKPDEVQAIKAAARTAFGDDAVVRLFGSRVRDDLRGGDIDLHFEVAPGRGTDREIVRFENALFERIDDQRVDTLFTVRGTPPTPFERIAYRDGIVL